MLTVNQVIKETGISRTQVMQLVHSRDSRWFQLGGRGGKWYVEQADLNKQIERRIRENGVRKVPR